MVLTAIGRQVQVPVALSCEQWLAVGLRTDYAHVPGLVTTDWWDWMGEWYHREVGKASAGLMIILMLLNGVVMFFYE